jgi:hypothetical protein
MRVFLQFLVAAALILWLAAVSLTAASDYLIKDMVELHGSRLAGAAVRIKDVSIDRKGRNFSLHDICVSGAVETQVLCAGSAVVKLPPGFFIEWRRASLLPDFLTVDSLDVKDVYIFYDIDSEGGGLRKLKFNLSEISSAAMRDRLNAKAQGTAGLLLLQVKTLKVSGIKVEAKSYKAPDRSKVFYMDDWVLADVSPQENGITSAEILDQVASTIVDGVQREARKQGLIERPSFAEDGKLSRKRAATKGEQDSESNEESGAGKTVRSIGADLKKTGSDIWQGTKKLFD